MEAVSGTGWTSYASASILAIAQERPGGFNVGATHRNGRRYAFRSRRAITSGSSLALIGNASGRLWGRAESRSEAFSMRRLGGSRWRLRRTRCAMGFERQLVAESKTGRELEIGRASCRERVCIAVVGRGVQREK